MLAQRRAGNDLSIFECFGRAWAQHLDWLCSGEQVTPSIGTLIFFGVLCLLPEVEGWRPLVSRSLKTRARLAVSVEGGPVPEEMAFLVAVDISQRALCTRAAGCWRSKTRARGSRTWNSCMAQTCRGVGSAWP